MTSKCAVAMQGIDTVIHMSALLLSFNPALALREKYERINVGGTANVVKSARSVRCEAGGVL